MAAGIWDTGCSTNETYSRVLTFFDASKALVDLSGYTAAMEIRQTAGGTLVVRADTSPGAGEGTIALSTGTITITIPESLTTHFAVGAWVYDLVITDGNSVPTQLLRGRFVVTPGVTQ